MAGPLPRAFPSAPLRNRRRQLALPPSPVDVAHGLDRTARNPLSRVVSSSAGTGRPLVVRMGFQVPGVRRSGACARERTKGGPARYQTAVLRTLDRLGVKF